MLVTGGQDKNGNTLSDMWILDVKSGRWREVRDDVNVNVWLLQSQNYLSSQFYSIWTSHIALTRPIVYVMLIAHNGTNSLQDVTCVR